MVVYSYNPSDLGDESEGLQVWGQPLWVRLSTPPKKIYQAQNVSGGEKPQIRVLLSASLHLFSAKSKISYVSFFLLAIMGEKGKNSDLSTVFPDS